MKPNTAIHFLVPVLALSIGISFAQVSGKAPGYPGLQQINMTLPASMAGVGQVPVMVTSNGQASNVTYMSILPTTAMMQGMPGWGSGMMVGENKVSGINVNAAGTQVTASVQVLATATAGPRQIRLGTSHGDMMGPMSSTLFTVTQ